MSIEQWALVVAFISLASSIVTFALQQREQDRARRGDISLQQRRLLIDLVQAWLSPEEQASRRAVYSARDRGLRYDQMAAEQQEHANHAMSMLNLVAYLYETQQVPRDEAIGLFGSAAIRVHDAAEEIGHFEVREQWTGRSPWRHLRLFVQDARASSSALKDAEELRGSSRAMRAPETDNLA